MSHSLGGATQLPPPGSADAIAVGCRCPVLPNSSRVLVMWRLTPLIAPDCPMHGFDPAASTAGEAHEGSTV